MMRQPPPSIPPPDAGSEPDAQQDIERLLEAEREARAAVAACEAQGARIVAEARLCARRIAERADRRMAALRAAAEARLRTERDRLAAEERALTDRPPPPELQARMAAAVDALADELTGQTP